MTRSFRAFLFVVALLFSQHAAMLHDLAHARPDAALAEHGVAECVAYFSLAHALGSTAVATNIDGVHPDLAVVAPETPAVSSRIVFDSRAPPLSS